ncbi:glycosyl hydrolase family 95 catalytic domain-containing protein [Streptomyces sp. NPDC020681]|uniref:glycosyl hydrolase family 95 catalytic domain-containing protein n=1 Tax=Streptomyces sp. NPDC020681 TaxID=3365083 RepID=UPI003792C1DF
MDDQHAVTPAQPSRRGFLSLATALGTATALGGLPAFTATAAPVRPTVSPMPAQASTTRLWYRAPASDRKMIEQALPVGNGRLGALVSNDPGRELLCVTDASLWTGHLNDTLDQDGQFPYERQNFGSFTLLAQLIVEIPDHELSAVSEFRRTLDLSQGTVGAEYRRAGVTYERQIYASRPDDAIVIRLTQRGGGSYTGSITLDGTHGETTSADGAKASLWFGDSFDNGLRYGAAVTARGRGGPVAVSGSRIVFTRCSELTIVISGGTNYAPDAATGYRDPKLVPSALARTKATAAVRQSPTDLLYTHVADYRELFDRMSLSLGESSEEQRRLDTWERLKARTQQAEPDPELEAAYVQFGRYLMISGSRDGLPLNLQGLWLDGNDPDWMGDYHSDVNIQMNYWMADRTGLSSCFGALADYCLAQLPSWSKVTRELFNDPRNRFRNTSGKVAGWTVAYSTNVHGGLGWWWHPPGNAWLCQSLWEHYEFTQDTTYLAKIYPLLKGAVQFWEARLVTMTVGGREVLVADHDWSPEHGPQDARGITYAQELVRELFANYRQACAVLRKDSGYGRTVGALQDRLYMPEVSPKTGWLQEWMSPDNLGETTHRHLSPLIGLFPGDRIRPDAVPDELLKGATALLTARGMESFGWANAWRALCWARLKHADNAYQLFVTNLRPSTGGINGTAMNLFDIYEAGQGRGIFQIDANFGTPSAVIEMLVYSRPGQVELLPALPAAWSASGSVTGVGVRGGFTLDLNWRDSKPERARIVSVGGRTTTVSWPGGSRTVTLRPGQSVTLRDFG